MEDPKQPGADFAQPEQKGHIHNAGLCHVQAFSLVTCRHQRLVSALARIEGRVR